MTNRDAGETEGITLRLDKKVLAAYRQIASRANLIQLQNGGKGQLTAQDVMRHRLSSLPLIKNRLKGSGADGQ